MPTTSQIKQIIHQSRRGLKELDVILEKFNQQKLKGLDDDSCLHYIKLLQSEDHDLLNQMLDENSQSKIVKKIMGR